jgi:DNA-binding NarL/FixJ family response regulator
LLDGGDKQCGARPRPRWPYFMPPRILIADDNDIFRKALRQLLEGVDHWEIVEVSDGDQAITKSVETRPDVIILDLAMPGKDGFTAARDISALLPATPILMCTMHTSPHVDAEAMKSGVRQVFSKTDSALLVPAIRQLLNPAPPTDEATAVETIAPAVVSDPVVPDPASETAPTEAVSDPAPPKSPENAA